MEFDFTTSPTLIRFLRFCPTLIVRSTTTDSASSRDAHFLSTLHITCLRTSNAYIAKVNRCETRKWMRRRDAEFSFYHQSFRWIRLCLVVVVTIDRVGKHFPSYVYKHVERWSTLKAWQDLNDWSGTTRASKKDKLLMILLCATHDIIQVLIFGPDHKICSLMWCVTYVYYGAAESFA